MLDLAWAMAVVLGTWALWIAALLGWGLLLRRALGGRGRWGWPGWWGQIDGDELHTCFWLGFAAVIAGLALYHLALPIDHLAMTGVLGVGLAGVIWHGRSLVATLTPRPAVALSLALVAVWLANRALGPGDAHDSGLYHYPAMAWYNAHRIVPGLGNLMPTLGMHHSGLLYAAVLDTGPWDGRAQHFVNGTLILPVVARILVAANRLLRRVGEMPAMDVYYLAITPMLAMLAFSKDIFSPTTDPALGLAGFVAIGETIRLALGRDWPRDRQRFALVTITILCALLVVLKLSTGFLALGLWIVAVAIYVRHSGRIARPQLATLAIVVAASSLLVGPWMARQVILSGYPLYPSTAIAAPVDWAVPPDRVQPLSNQIYRHVRGGLPLWISQRVQGTPVAWYGDWIDPPFESIDEIERWQWVRPWAVALPVSSFAEAVLPALAAVGALLWLGWRRRRAGGDDDEAAGVRWLKAGAGVLVVLGVAIVAWFLVAPGPRYAWPVFWPLAAMLTAAAATAGRGQASPPRRTAVALILLALALSAAVYAYRAGVEWVQRDQRPTALLWRGPGEDDGFHRVPEVEYETFTTRHGLTLYTPVTGVNCWRAPLLCAAWLPLDEDLRLRRDGELRHGFVTDRR